MGSLLKRSWKIGIPLLFVLAFIAWRATRPRLTDEQKIQTNIQGLQQAVKNKSGNGILRYLAPEFRWNNMSRKELGSYMGGFFWQARDVNLDLVTVTTRISGDTATTSGRFIFSYKPTPEANLESKSGEYVVNWKREKDDWIISSATGGEAAVGTP